jgi:hypothetical protein
LLLRLIAEHGYEVNGGGFNNAQGRLRTLELVQGRGELHANENLFDASSQVNESDSSAGHQARHKWKTRKLVVGKGRRREEVSL